MTEAIKVKAYGFSTGNYIGEYVSCCKAERSLFLTKRSVSRYLLRLPSKGVKSKKTGKVYHFEKA